MDKLYTTRQFVFALNRIARINESTVFEIKDNLITGDLTRAINSIKSDKETNKELKRLTNSLSLNLEFLSNGEHQFIEVSKTDKPEMRVSLPFRFFTDNIQDQRVRKEILNS